jgi:hypothetical protein
VPRQGRSGSRWRGRCGAVLDKAVAREAKGAALPARTGGHGQAATDRRPRAGGHRQAGCRILRPEAKPSGLVEGRTGSRTRGTAATGRGRQGRLAPRPAQEGEPVRGGVNGRGAGRRDALAEAARRVGQGARGRGFAIGPAHRAGRRRAAAVPSKAGPDGCKAGSRGQPPTAAPQVRQTEGAGPGPRPGASRRRGGRGGAGMGGLVHAQETIAEPRRNARRPGQAMADILRLPFRRPIRMMPRHATDAVPRPLRPPAPRGGHPGAPAPYPPLSVPPRARPLRGDQRPRQRPRDKGTNP